MHVVHCVIIMNEILMSRSVMVVIKAIKVLRKRSNDSLNSVGSIGFIRELDLPFIAYFTTLGLKCYNLSWVIW